MARGRMVSTTIATDKALNSLSLEAELLYLKAVPHLDRDGLIVGDDDLLIAKIAPRRQRELFDLMEPAICEWIEAGLVLRYDSKDSQVLYFQGFAKNNKIRYDQEGPSNFPPPPGFTRTESGLEPDGTQEKNDVRTLQERGKNVPATFPKPLNEREGKLKVKAMEEKNDDDEGAGAPVDADTAKAFTAFQNDIHLVASPYQAQEMSDVIDRLKARNVLDWWHMAVRIACDNNARKWSYVKAVLENALADGRAPGTNKPRTNGQAQRTKSYDNLAQGYSTPAGYEDVVNVDARTVAAPDPWRDLLAEADALAPMVRQTPQVKERTLKQLARKLDGMLAALPVPYDAAVVALGERLA
jgi:hypothetical protein